MPTHRTGQDIQQGPIRLKNLLGVAEKMLLAKGVRHPEVQQLFQEAETLFAEGGFWQRQREGLALFLSPDMFRRYRLPLEFDEMVMVAERFHLKPLFPILSSDNIFYVLALSQNEISQIVPVHAR